MNDSLTPYNRQAITSPHGHVDSGTLTIERYRHWDILIDPRQSVPGSSTLVPRRQKVSQISELTAAEADELLLITKLKERSARSTFHATDLHFTQSWTACRTLQINCVPEYHSPLLSPGTEPLSG